ncbi:MAG: type II toxin-antitoxin system RelE/ParE family toxin [Tepidisphaeraceae bacterium]|jgi:hypothetical protein
MWAVETTDDFDAWFSGLNETEREEIYAVIGLLKVVGPQLKRPHADTLGGSAYANMKELRANTAGAVLRAAFAFDPLRTAILLTGGDKSGVSERRFYKQLIAKADKLYGLHLEKINKRMKEKGKGK